ncbi:hypothetical protein ANO14919_110250 [Xylariales sp. No.14919]|nr:hypothetical protein ANO14919_110250 [Xylariales sp. No.14919]
MSIPPKGIHKVSMGPMLCLCDRMEIPEVYHLAMSNRSLWASLQYYLYKRAAKSRKESLNSVPNLIIYGITAGWETRSLELAIEACRVIWPRMLDGLDDRRAWPPLFEAVDRKRHDVVSLLEENLADFTIRYEVSYRSRFAEILSCGRSAWVGGVEHSYAAKFQFHATPGTVSEMIRTGALPGNIGVHEAEGSEVRDGADYDSVLEVAVKKMDLELTEKYLANPQMPVRPVTLMLALDLFWTVGIDAILTSGRLEQAQVNRVLDKVLLETATFEGFSNKIEYLVSIGADAEFRYSSPDADLGPEYKTALSQAIGAGRYENASKLLEVFEFDHDYLMHMLRRCVLQDFRLAMTKTLLEHTNADATGWKEAYAAAISTPVRMHCNNEQTIQFLVKYAHELVRSGVEMELNKPMKYLVWPRREYWIDSENTFLEHVLVATMEKAKACKTKGLTRPNDFVRPLFQYGVDATLLSNEGWQLYQQYFKEFVRTRERRDEILSSYRQETKDADAVFPEMKGKGVVSGSKKAKPRKSEQHASGSNKGQWDILPVRRVAQPRR